MSKIYGWEDEIVLDALHHFAYKWAGENDADFITECMIQAYCDPAWEACVVMDYIEEMLGSKLDNYTEQYATIKKISTRSE